VRGARLCDSVLPLHFTNLCRNGSEEFGKEELEEKETLTQPSRIDLPNKACNGY
jgi:hypothetical protein